MKLKKRSKKDSSLSVKTGQIGPDIPTVTTGPLGGDIGTANSAASSFKGADLSAISKLRAAKKKPQLVGDVTLGPTETSEVREEAQAPRSSKYLERLRKRAK